MSGKVSAPLTLYTLIRASGQLRGLAGTTGQVKGNRLTFQFIWQRGREEWSLACFVFLAAQHPFSLFLRAAEVHPHSFS